MAINMKEAALRDLIAGHIQKLKPGLKLFKKEQYIPGKYGTDSFIDLYAADEENRHVLIELKRSDAAARQALHEVTKYVENVKEYLGARDGEIHVIIASTKWHELLLPFSRFAKEAGFSIEGLSIEVTDNGADFEVSPITPLPIIQGRLIAPWHNLYWYKDENSLKSGIEDIEKVYAQKGIEDYVIAVFYLPDESTPEERQEAMRQQVVQLIGSDAAKLPQLPEVPVYEYIAYTALQMLSRETCMEILSKDSAIFHAAEEFLADEDLAEEDILAFLHDEVEAAEPVPYRDFYEIGSPAKFSRLYDAANSNLRAIIRHGLFQRNTLLHDDILCAEIAGEDGATGEKLRKIVRMESSAQVKELKSNIMSSLSDNPVWQRHILQIIDEIKMEFPFGELELFVFNPCTGVLMLYLALAKENGLLYIPSYRIVVRNPKEVRLYYGVMEPGGSALTLPQILDKYYMGNLEALLMSMTWGGRESRDCDIIEDMGLRYGSYRMKADNDFPVVETLQNGRWHPAKFCMQEELLAEYMEKNLPLLDQIMIKIASKDKGMMFNCENPSMKLAEYMDMDMAKKRKKYFAGAPEVCDICKFPLEKEQFFADAKLRDNECWANMCGDCFLQFGDKIEWGYGQLYQRDAHGWLQVGGFCPGEDMEEEW